MGSSNETSFYGAVKNPWNTRAVPGGSSGGSAASVAARLAPAATGTDTGGSIRQPASFCGITGLKPTYGRVSRYGMIAFASSLDQAGPMAQSAEDCALLLNAMSGFDPRDSTSLEKDVPDYRAEINKPLKGLRIGLPKEYFGEGLNADINSVVQAALQQYRDMGAEIIDISLPNTHLAVPVYYVVAPAECSSNLSRFDGVRFGHRCDDPKDLEDLYKRSRGEGFGEEVKRRIMVGTYALSAGYYDAYYIKAQQLRRMISDDFKQAFEKVDVIMGPAAPETAFNIGEKTAIVGLFIGNKELWNKGYGTEAQILLLEYVFANLPLRKILADVHSLNIQSLKSFEKCGYKQEEVKKEDDPKISLSIKKEDFLLVLDKYKKGVTIKE
jgi:aspartyl-tRNA(Asn)/glutamyl-tRNA(Gln) amidotransferase subunit A